MALTELESGLDVKVESIIKRIEEVAAATESLATRQPETETCISTVEDDVAPLKKKLAALEKLNTTLTEKITDLEGHSRRDNIQILTP